MMITYFQLDIHTDDFKTTQRAQKSAQQLVCPHIGTSTCSTVWVSSSNTRLQNPFTKPVAL